MTTLDFSSKPTVSSSSTAASIELGNNMLHPTFLGSAPQATLVLPGFIRKAAHPSICLWHLCFKICAFLSYFILEWFTTVSIIPFVVTTIFLALDFWIVKNVSGRILVGMRWWSKVTPEGHNEWLFESLSPVEAQSIDAADKAVFWGSTYAYTAFWSVACIYNLFTLSLNDFVLCSMGLAFSGSNLLGYWKCSNRAGEVGKSIEGSLLTSWLSVFNGNS